VLFCLIAICASAKKESAIACIFGAMNTQLFHAKLIVEDVLKKWPETFSVFRTRNMDCIGCLLQRFCTLQDVAATYEMDIDNLKGELENCVSENHETRRRTL
jgi:hybrid cluster-associated redox disulfide protein